MKFIICMCLIALMATVAFAYTDRIEYLYEENLKIDNVIRQKQQEIRNLTQMKIENIGKIKELQRLSKEKEEKKEKS